MTFWIFAATITLSAFAFVTLVSSAAISWLAPTVADRLERYTAASRASLLFRLRLAPALLATFVALGIALPIFLAYEPRESDEALSRTLIVLAAAGVAIVMRAAWRAIAAWRATEAVRREWLARGRRLTAADGFETALPLFAIDESFPTVAVIGVSRPTLFVSERVLRECTADEVRVMLRHEAAHVAVGDNLKRFAIRACPDAILRGSALDRAWAMAAEEAADAAAVAGRPSSALELAEALIRVARLAPARTPELASAFYLGGSIESRIRRLISPLPAPEAPTPFGCVMLLGGGLSMLALIVASAPLLHQVMETLVSRLP